ncbi:VOC family protein [Salinibacterium sp. SWN1162]|uniref:VOC family protein n=1 Tax=Salinibacterium sp. SWN1162 TaxID=2792053 RepID=UPI0018CDA065|nr:VOC family protein [Salinibacterium sp. SWN1162]MBH0007814.1 VOC family protein [Salinibacterium sp. SWN1162]
MFAPKNAFSGFSVNDLDAAAAFYRDSLGLAVDDGGMGTLRLTLPGGAEVTIYPKENHEPASFTILNFAVEDVEAAVDALNERGVVTKIYSDDDLLGGMGTDAKGIMHGHGSEIAWFKDPAGNVLSVIAA